MKKLQSVPVMALSILLSVNAIGQQHQLTIGDKMPDISFSNVYNYSKNKISLSDFEGKNIVLDFWASWCGPCLEQMPVIDSIQEKYKDKLQIIAVTGEPAEGVSRTYASLKTTYGISPAPSIYDDTILCRLFPRRLIPHYIWIGKDRTVKAITDHYQFTSENINDFLEGKELKLPVKKDDMSGGFDYEIPLVKSGQLNAGKETWYNNSKMAYQSILLPADRSGIGSEVSGRYNYSTGVNTPLIILFKYAYSILHREIGWKFWDDSRFVLKNFNGKDSLDFGFRTYKTDPIWLKDELGKCYVYEIVFRDSVSDEYRAKCIIQDLNRHLRKLKGFEIKSEKRRFNYLELSWIDNSNEMDTKGGRPFITVTNDSIIVKNTSMSKLVEVLQPYCYTNGLNLPLIRKMDPKDYIDPRHHIDLAISIKDFSPEAINKELLKYNLQLEQKTEESRHMIIVTKK